MIFFLQKKKKNIGRNTFGAFTSSISIFSLSEVKWEKFSSLVWNDWYMKLRNIDINP